VIVLHCVWNAFDGFGTYWRIEVNHNQLQGIQVLLLSESIGVGAANLFLLLVEKVATKADEIL
jgi:hypothetical protein